MNIIFAGGGTGGHINPAIAVAKYILTQEKDANILFVGTRQGLESTLVPREGFALQYISAQGFQTSMSIKNIKPAAKFLLSSVKAAGILRTFGADAVIGTGGYVCAPVVFAANFKKIPTLIHEQNVFPGSAIRFLSKQSTVTAISFEESRKYLKGARRILLTGNPIRPSVLSMSRTAARRELGISDEKFIVATGGSLGAERMNEVLAGYIEKYARPGTRVLLSAGQRDFGRASGMLKGVRAACKFEVVPYIHNMDTVLAAADLVIGRAGAITLSELCARGVPSILVPSPNVANNHQEYNASALQKNGAAVMILERDFTPGVLSRELNRLLEDGRALKAMSESALAMAETKASERIYTWLKSVTRAL